MLNFPFCNRILPGFVPTFDVSQKDITLYSDWKPEAFPCRRCSHPPHFSPQAKEIGSVFARDMCVGKNTLQSASVRPFGRARRGLELDFLQAARCCLVETLPSKQIQFAWKGRESRYTYRGVPAFGCMGLCNGNSPICAAISIPQHCT